jgi:hypothetical protein
VNLGEQRRGRLDEFCAGRFHLLNLAVEVAQMPTQRRDNQPMARRGQPVGLPGAILDQLGAAGHELLQGGR